MSIDESRASAPSAAKTLPVSPAPLPASDDHVQFHLNGSIHGSRATAAAADTRNAPADFCRQPARRERLAWYAGAVAATCLLLAWGLRLDDYDFHTPFDYDLDALLIMPMVKATVEQGHHWRNERLGYPATQELYKFPVIDHLHFAIIWLIGRVIPDWIVVFNVYYLLTWPLTALTAMFALRYLRLSLPMAAAGAILYAFAPYHYLRGETHYFLAAYWMVPLSWLPALDLLQGNVPFFRRAPDGRYRLSLRRWATFWQILLAAATASAGAYYAFFACAVYAAAGVYGWIAHRTWKALASAGILAVLVAAAGVVNHLPAFLYVLKYDEQMVIGRTADESELYGMKIAHLLLPIDNHNLLAFAKLKDKYNTDYRPSENENAFASLGFISAAGLLILLTVLLLPVPKRWPYGPLAALAGFIVLFATIGGFSSLFSLLVFPQIRCPNRFSIYLSFICLFTVLWPLDRFLASRSGWARRLLYPAAAGLAALGVLDQSPVTWFSQAIVEERQSTVERFRADGRFFVEIEETMPSGSKVFMLPHMQYPEVPNLYELAAYEHLRGYLHTRTLFWSYGAIKTGDKVDNSWQQQVSELPKSEFLSQIVAAGFDGLIVDKRGYPTAKTWVGRFVNPDEGELEIAEIKREAEKNGEVRIPMIYHEDRQQVFFDLRPYRAWLNLHHDPKP